MHSPLLTGISKQNNYEIFPASPILLEALNIPLETQDYIQKRNTLLSYKTDLNVVYDSRLRPYQNADVHFLSTLSKGKGVFNQQRTGKTPTTLVTMRILNQNKNIIIVPKSTILPWTQEFKEWHSDNVLRIKSWWPQSKRKKEYEKNKDKTIILNYHKVRTDLELLKSLGPFDAVVLDEAQVMRNYIGSASKTVVKYNKEYKSYDSPAITRAIMEIRKISKDAYALTGTPSPTKQHNIYGILVFMFPDLFNVYNKVINYYFSRYLNEFGYNGGAYVISGFHNKHKEQEMIEFLETFSVQRKRADVMTWLPKVDKRVIKFEMPKKMRTWHTELEKYFETEHIICQEGLTVMIKQRQLCVSPLALELKEIGEKFKWILEYIEDYPEKPIIITGWFSSALEILSNLIKSPHGIMTGKTPENKRHEIVQNFQEKQYNIIIGNISVMSLGLNISRAEEIIMIDPSLTEGENDQISDRFVPTIESEALSKEGQMVTRLIYEDSIDTYIYDSLIKKATEIDIINNYIKHLDRRTKM